MGKKRRMIAHPEKYKTKRASHPAIDRYSNQEQIEALAVATQESVVEVPPAKLAEEKPEKEIVAPPKRRSAVKPKVTRARAKKTSSKK